MIFFLYNQQTGVKKYLKKYSKHDFLLWLLFAKWWILMGFDAILEKRILFLDGKMTNYILSPVRRVLTSIFFADLSDAFGGRLE